MSSVTMREMLEAGVHFGHQTRYWDPGMAPYLFGQRNKIHIINLEKTLPLYEEAINFIGKMAAKKGTILFVGTKRSAQSIIVEEAQRCGMPYVNRRWLGGLLTNFRTVRSSINRLKEIEAMQSDGSMERVNKKEQLMCQRELEKLKANLFGIKEMNSIPDALFIIDVGYENIAVNEAVKLRIPVIGVVDSNNSLKNIDYVIPGNDDAIRSISLYAKGAADAILEGHQSVAHLGDGKDSDELIEIDDSGSPIEVVEPVVKRRIAKKVVKKKIVNKPAVAAEEAPSVDPAAEETTESGPKTKKVAKKKIVNKPAVAAEEAPSVDPAEEAPSVDPAEEEPSADPAEEEPSVDLAAEETTESGPKIGKPKNIAWIEEKLIAKVVELNAAFGIGKFKFKPQPETKANLSICGINPKKNGRICVQPTAKPGQCDVSVSGQSIEKEMDQYMCDLFKCSETGFKHPNKEPYCKQPYWRTSDFDKVLEAIDHYAKVVDGWQSI